jgi:trans-aconitate methyltransferase
MQIQVMQFPGVYCPHAIFLALGFRMKETPSVTWNPKRISTIWFDSHFNHAAQRVIDWISAEQDIHGLHSLLDFGCGGAITTLGVALRFPEVEVFGVDIGDKFLQLPGMAREQLGLERLPQNLHLHRIEPRQSLAENFRSDAVFTWSVFEHIPQEHIPGILEDLHACLAPGGLFFLQIEPLYHSAWGSHLRRFVETPWAHLLWTDEELRQAVLDYDGDIPPQHQGHQYRERDMQDFKHFHLGEFESLNRVTANQISRMVRDAGFGIIREQRLTLDIAIPENLLEQHDAEDLRTNGILLLARKEQASGGAEHLKQPLAAG